MAVELGNMKKDDLIDTCKKEGIKGYSTRNKDDIIELILNTRNTEFQKLKIKTVKHTKLTLENNTVSELRELSKELGLKTSGKKEKLIEEILKKKKNLRKKLLLYKKK